MTGRLSENYNAISSLILAAVTLSSTGCLSMWGQSHSSLRPRTASLSTENHSVVRSQDAQLLPKRDSEGEGLAAGYSFGRDERTFSPAASGYADSSTPRTTSSSSVSVPRARLLLPDFGSGAQAASPATGLNPHVDAVAQEHSPSHVGATAARSDDRLLGGMTAAGLRQLMNQKSQSEMSEAQVLSNLSSQWTVKTTSDNSTTVGQENLTSTTGVTQGQNAQVPAQTVSDSLDVTSQQSAQPSAESEDQNVFDRLRGFYGSQVEQNSRQRWMKPFQRLPSPWSVFRDRDETDTPPAVPQTSAELPDEIDPQIKEDIVPSRVSQLVKELIPVLSEELENWPRLPGGSPQNLTQYQRRQQDLRLLYLIDNQPGAAIGAVESLPPEEQDFWQQVMLGLAQYRSVDTEMSRDQRITNTAGQMLNAARQLMPLATLKFRRMDLCSRIYSYGRIETFPSNSFDPGQPILLYVELENFSSQLTLSGSYQTNFDAVLQFYEDGNDEPIETIELPDISDEATSERFDYFQSFELNVPSHLEAGRYRIQLRLRDRNSGKTAEESVSFLVR